MTVSTRILLLIKNMYFIVKYIWSAKSFSLRIKLMSEINITSAYGIIFIQKKDWT